VMQLGLVLRSQFSLNVMRGRELRRFCFDVFVLFLPRDALQCKAWYWDCMSSGCPSVCLSVRPWRWWIRTT